MGHGYKVMLQKLQYCQKNVFSTIIKVIAKCLEEQEECPSSLIVVDYHSAQLGLPDKGYQSIKLKLLIFSFKDGPQED